VCIRRITQTSLALIPVIRWVRLRSAAVWKDGLILLFCNAYHMVVDLLSVFRAECTCALRGYFYFHKTLKFIIVFIVDTVISVVNILTIIPINPSMTLGFLFRLPPRTEGYSVYGTLKCFHYRTAHRGRQHVKSYRFVQCTEACSYHCQH
jgi:hypothetical protein